MPETKQKPFIPSFARRSTRSLKSNKKKLLEELLPTLQINEENLDHLFNFNPKKIAMEIGFGSGEHLVHQAEKNPDIGYIGAEIYDSGIATCLSNIEKKGLKNIRLYTEDARILVEKLPDNYLDICYILFPDPWPKTRHHKRRLVNQETLNMLTRVIKKDGILYFATDHQDYCRWIMVQMNVRDDFTWLANSKKDWQNPHENYTTTRYEEKKKASFGPAFLSFRKN